MTIRDQLVVLEALRVEYVVVGGQAGVMRQAVEFSHDLDILVPRDELNAQRVREAVRTVTTREPDIDTLVGRGFQQYVHPETGEELDVHLELIALADYASGLRNASAVDYLGVSTQCLELPALYASKRTDRPRDALHRQAIEQRLANQLRAGSIEPDEIVLACCLDASLAPLSPTPLSELATSTSQPLLQARLLALPPDLLDPSHLATNPTLHPTVRAVMTLDSAQREKLLGHRGRLAALLAKLPVLLPPQGFHVRAKTRV